MDIANEMLIIFLPNLAKFRTTVLNQKSLHPYHPMQLQSPCRDIGQLFREASQNPL